MNRLLICLGLVAATLATLDCEPNGAVGNAAWCNGECNAPGFPGGTPNCQLFCSCQQAAPAPAGCAPVGVFASVPGMQNWCELNCAAGYCPPNYCTEGCLPPSTDLECMGQVTYDIVFTGTFSNATHPVDYQMGAHFSPVIGASHADDFAMFQRGTQATLEMQIVAELGAPGPMANLLTTEAFQFAVGSGPIPSNGTENLSFDVDGTNHYISVVSMIAPSPDWFAGLNTYDMCDHATGMWRSSVSLDISAYDAGTDSGLTFTAVDQVTDPQENIFLIGCDGHAFCAIGEEIAPVAHIMMTLV